MSDNTIDLPKVGPVNKYAVFGVGAVAVAFIGWKYYQSHSEAAAAAATTDTTNDSSFTDPGSIPSVDGGGGSGNLYGLPDTGDEVASTTTYGFTGTTNDQWSQYASTQLEQSETWSYTDIVGALGNYLNNQPLSSTQQQIVQAAIAVAGYPPVGTHTIIPGGDTAITVAPTGVTVTSTTSNTAVISFSPVAGAEYYRGYRSGVATNVSSSNGSPMTIAGLEPNTTYSFWVAAVSKSGALGPNSAKVSGKTKAITLAKPATPHATSITTTGFTATTSNVTGAEYYRWYLNGTAHGASDNPTYKFTGLKKGTKYTVTVAADTTSNTPGPVSSSLSVTTKSK